MGRLADVEKLFPICTPGCLGHRASTKVLELLHLGGRSLAHAVLMIPEAWGATSRWTARQAFCTSITPSLMEPWDVASMTFCDGTVWARWRTAMAYARVANLGHRATVVWW